MDTRAEVRGYGSNNRYEDTNEEDEVLDNEVLDNEDELLMITPSKDNLDEYLYDNERDDQQYDIEQEDGADNENLSDNELNILQQLEEHEANEDGDNVNEDLEGDGGNGRIYQNKLCKPVVAVGNTKIGLSQAKLFGLLDDKGNVKINKGPGVDRGNQHKKILAMSKPREIDPDLIDNASEKPSFAPSRTKEALNAMKNPKCGYDFVNRMKDDTSTFLDRVDRGAGKKGNYTKAELDTLEADYAIKLDKLQCPQCKKPQSFDEYIEKKRNCSQCNKKFDKLNVTSGISFAAKAQEKEAERRAKLRAQEVAMYGEKCVSYALPRTKPAATPPIPPPDKNASNSKFIRENILKISQQQQAKKLPPIGDEGAAPEDGPGIAYAGKKTGKKLSLDADKIIINKQQDGLPWINMVEKIAVQNTANNELLNATLANLQQQYGAYVEDGNGTHKSAKPPRSAPSTSKGSNSSRPKSASAASKGTLKDKTTMKFEKLLDVNDTTFE